MISIILMEPENPGNIGAVARVMANFEQESLVLVRSKADHLSPEAIARSKHAKHILEKAEIISRIEGFDTIIGTTSKLGNEYNLPRNPLVPSEILGIIASDNAKTGILFGREGTGLSNDELRECDFTITIPSSESYSALNLSHSVGIICYELFKAKNEEKLKNRFRSIQKAEKMIILKKIQDVLDRLDFATEKKKETQILFWRRILGKSFVTEREAYILLGFLKKLEEKI